MPIRRKNPDEHANKKSDNAGGLRWLLTYSDMITLLLALFIVLYALASTDNQKFQAMATALAKEFNAVSVVGTAPGPSMIAGQSGTQATAPVAPHLSPTLSHLVQRLQQAVDAAHLQSEVTIRLNAAGVRVSLEANLLFPSALATLSPKAVTLLQKIGTILDTVPNAVEVIGDTDSTPIHTAQYPSNWQLGAARSANVTQLLASRMAPTRLIQVSFSKYEPIAGNYTSAGRQANRRVDLLVLTRALGAVLKDTGTVGVPVTAPYP
ncbi:MAG: OmpA family protein [Thermaerobacter sp.]|nr:OmpA family protein [Thermaerobacter sp.]